VIALPRGSTLVVASHNKGKVREIEELLAPLGFEIKGAAELGLPEPEENGASFTENALIKARSAARVSGLPSLSDDSGLCVGALDGAPGIYSARWAGEGKDFRIAMKRVEDELNGNPDRRAFFVCVLAMALPGGHEETFEGRVYGTLTFPPRGERGFGYDPIFIPEGHRFTFGEMDPAAKHAMSHRAKAFEKFSAALVLEKS
jgi:XTP/dITP diphosphohydrolase